MLRLNTAGGQATGRPWTTGCTTVSADARLTASPSRNGRHRPCQPWGCRFCDARYGATRAWSSGSSSKGKHGRAGGRGTGICRAAGATAATSAPSATGSTKAKTRAATGAIPRRGPTAPAAAPTAFSGTTRSRAAAKFSYAATVCAYAATTGAYATTNVCAAGAFATTNVCAASAYATTGANAAAAGAPPSSSRSTWHALGAADAPQSRRPPGTAAAADCHRAGTRTCATRVGKLQQPRAANARSAIDAGVELMKEAAASGASSSSSLSAYAKAAECFQEAMTLSPNEDEARAAMFNLGCAYAKAKRWKDAVQAVTVAVNDYRLKLSVALKDEDLAELRDRREWIDAVSLMRGGLTDEAKLTLRSEARSPFRFARIVIFGALGIGAGIGLLIITTRLASAIRGGSEAPDLGETAKNFAINASAIAVFGTLLYRELQARDRDKIVTGREDRLARLQIELGKDRLLPLLKLRGQVRPLLIAGRRNFVEKAMKEAQIYYVPLRERGVSLVPLVTGAQTGWSGEDPERRIKALKKSMTKSQSTPKGFDAADVGTLIKERKTEGSFLEEDKKWQLTTHSQEEWQEWLAEQKNFAKLPENEANCWVQVQLDGTIKGSGLGQPPFSRLVDELPPLDDIKTKISDNIGTNV